MRNAFIQALYELAALDPRICALISDNGAIVFDRFKADFGDRLINFGISECNMIAAAAGMASLGLIPFAYTISNFLSMRAFEFIRNDICINKANVKLVGIGAGFSYSALGTTHHGTEDMAILRPLPSLYIVSPASAAETKAAVQAMASIEAPVYLRLGGGGLMDADSTILSDRFALGKGVRIKNGKDLSLLSTGSILTEVIQAAKDLEALGIEAGVVHIHTVKPIDEELILSVATESAALVTIEEHSVTGGLGDAVLELCARKGCLPKRFLKIGLEGFAVGYGSYAYLKKANGLDAEGIVKRILRVGGAL